jgi:hypothetical protein
MTVAVQYNATLDTTKYRPCIDLSRHVNPAIARSTVKLDDLTVAEELILPGDYMTSLDMENQYFHIRLHPSMTQYMGFMVLDPDGTPRYYTFQVMAYGCKPAVTIVTRLLRPIKAFLHRFGIKFTIYIDDGRISAATPRLCSDYMNFTLQVLQLAGWKIQWKKTVLVPTQRLLHLGFITDSVSMTYSITDAKWTTVQLTLSDALAKAASATLLPVTDTASLLGRLSSQHRSHGSVVRVLSRSLQHQLCQHVQLFGWTGSFLISPASQAELTLLIQQLPASTVHSYQTPTPSLTCTPCRTCSPRRRIFCTLQTQFRHFSFQTRQPPTPSSTWQTAPSHMSLIFLLQTTKRLLPPASGNCSPFTKLLSIIHTFSPLFPLS